MRRLLHPDPAALHVELRSVPARTVVAVSDHVALDEAVDWYDTAMAELNAAFPPAERTGPPAGRYANELFIEDAGTMTVFRAAREPRWSARIDVVELSAVDLAVAVHPGPHDDIDVTYGRLGGWSRMPRASTGRSTRPTASAPATPGTPIGGVRDRLAGPPARSRLTSAPVTERAWQRT
ncbi:hypothetical protein GCM10027290_44260 [Micromonospora sonneratiae]|uniref:GyrI-like small molecule binding domain-containing protein n=1 Tax=Micromonospora sonneratiae TaxID=1184706 RepID=A0ABW3YA29_9ACTN